MRVDEINMNLDPFFFSLIKNNLKSVEVRLYDSKRKRVQRGSIIRFKKVDSREDIMRVVRSVTICPDFEHLKKAFKLKDFGYTYRTFKELEQDLLKIYSVEEIKEYGFVAIRLDDINLKV